MSILAVGDFFQPPSVKQSRAEWLFKENPCYPCDFWIEDFQLVELDEIMRQRENLEFAENLNRLRTRTSNEELGEHVLQMLKRCVRGGNENSLHVFATNVEVNEHNLKMINSTCTDLREILAKDFERDKTSGKMTLREKPFVRHKTDGMSSVLVLSVSARVMLIRNIDVSDGLVNGVIGTVLEISEESNGDIKSITVSFDNKKVGEKTEFNRVSYFAVQIHRCEEEMKTTSNKSFTRHQFPLRLAWACTAYKVQGLTTTEIAVDLNKVFSAGQAYVALSRVTSEKGLSISVSNDGVLKSKIYADKEVSEALSKMPRFFTGNNKDLLDNKYIRKIILHNIQSLRQHFNYMAYDCRFKDTDVICLTETWLSNVDPLENFHLEKFHLHHLTRSEAYEEADEMFSKLKRSKGGGIAVYLKDKCNITRKQLPVQNIEGILLEDHLNSIIYVVLYRPNVYALQIFLMNLEMLLKSLDKRTEVKVVMGDFNENILASNISTIKLMKSYGYQQTVDFPTTENATLIDHVYTKLQKSKMQTTPLPT